MKLNTSNLSKIASLAKIITPNYDRDQVRQGIVHIGVGGFHRAHLALYIEKLLNLGANQDWGICGVGLLAQDSAMQQMLVEQDFLYTLVELQDTDDTETQIIGSIGDFILADQEKNRLIDKLLSDDTKIVSLTITEGGYCIDDSTGEFDPSIAQIQQDLNNPQNPNTIFGYLTLALKKRKEAGQKAITIMSCDNLPHNGDITKKVLLSFSRLIDPQLSEWIAHNVSFPNSMVDRITPATSADHKRFLLEKTGIEDSWPVVCEPFTQWVVEDNFCNGRPDFEKVGVQFTDNVGAFEAMKIGLLNGSHLMLACTGILLGYEFAHQTMQDSSLRRYVRQFMDNDVTPRLDEIVGVDFEEYKNTLIFRFANVEICDQLLRIASDSCAKYPKFILPTLQWLIARNKPLDRIALMTAAWIKCVTGALNGDTAIPNIVDPKQDVLVQAVSKDSKTVENFLAIEDVFGSHIAQNQQFVELVTLKLEQIETLGMKEALVLTVSC
jgi:mannitol 2-dehydrogenase